MKAHLVGGGLASLAAAVYLIKDGNILGSNITIHDRGSGLGGCLASSGNAETGYVIPVGRVFEKEYRCTAELLSFIPSVSDASRSVWHEIEEFHDRHGWYDKTRLVGAGATILDAGDLGLSTADKLAMTRLLLMPERLLEGKRLDEWFEAHFFTSNFFYMWATIMGSLEQHSLLEMQRFMNRFMHLLPDLAPMTMIYRTRYHQDETIRQPLEQWLNRHGVKFHLNATVTDVDFVPSATGHTAQAIYLASGDGPAEIPVARDDIVLVTNGSQISDMSVGSMDEPATPRQTGEGWKLWDTLARGRPGFGNPRVFFGRPRDSSWVMFTVTARDTAFFERFAAFTGSPTGRQGLVTLTASNWLLTVVTFHQPHFIGQPPGVQLWWGYGIRPGRPGNFVKKPMADCSGREILDEVLRHLEFADVAERIAGNSICIPVLLPEANALWAVRQRSDRPRPVPEGSTNFGFIGQFTEVAADAVFTMEYSIRSAREAVSGLLKLDRQPPPPYQGLHDPDAMYKALKALA
jgi:oleate hydratase